MDSHIFTESGLGNAPFKFLGVVENMYTPVPGLVPAKPGGSCAHCATGIRWEHVIESADGVVSTVGSSCIRKAGDKGLITAMKAEQRRRAKAKRDAERMARTEARLAQERQQNGGLTNHELEARRATERAEAQRQADMRRAALLSEIADSIDGESPFRASVAAGMRGGQIPTGRGRVIVAEIVAKAAGRRGTPAYQFEFERVIAVMERAEAA